MPPAESQYGFSRTFRGKVPSKNGSNATESNGELCQQEARLRLYYMQHTDWAQW